MSKRHLVNKVAPLLRGRSGERLVLYIGDWEVGGPGDQIEDHVRRTLAEHTGRRFIVGANWIRIALTEEQVNTDSRLLALKITKTDSRYKGGKQYEAVEAEALGQGVIVQVLRDRFDRMLAERGLPDIESVQAREERSRTLGPVLRGVPWPVVGDSTNPRSFSLASAATPLHASPQGRPREPSAARSPAD
jgi:hypothetical protein